MLSITLQNKDQTTTNNDSNNNVEFGKLDVSPGTKKIKKANSFKVYHKTKVYFSKSQSINLISPAPNFNLDTIQINIKSLSTILMLSSLQIYLSGLSISDLST